MMIKGLAHLPSEEMLRELELLSLEKKWLRSIEVYKYMVGEGGVWVGKAEKTEPDSVVPSDRIRDIRHKLKYRKFYLNLRNQVFSVRVTEHWNRLSREAVESSCLEIFKTQLSMILGNLFYLSLLCAVGLSNVQWCFQPSAFHPVISRPVNTKDF